MAYFNNFPLITYKGITLRNIILRAAIIDEVFSAFDVFHPYVIQDWERPDTIASDYYGDPNYFWVVLLANKIDDIVSGWPLTQADLNAYIAHQYASSVPATMSTIRHYTYTGIGGESDYNIARKSWEMTPATYAALSGEDSSGWTPVYTYDWEVEQNNNKRTIRLLDARYIKQLEREISAIFGR